MKRSISILLASAIFLLTIPVYTFSYEYTHNNAYHNYQSYNNNNISNAIKAGVIICSLVLICKVIKLMNTPLTEYEEQYLIPRLFNKIVDETLGKTWQDKVKTTSSILFITFTAKFVSLSFPISQLVQKCKDKLFK